MQTRFVDVRIVERSPIKVAYLRHVGPYGQPLSEFWDRTVYPWMERNGLLDRPHYGIARDDPNAGDPDALRYDAAVELGEDVTVPGADGITELPGGTYAAGQFRGTVAEIGPAWSWIFEAWLPRSGMQLDDRPMFEHYPTLTTFEEQTGVFECDICIPVSAAGERSLQVAARETPVGNPEHDKQPPRHAGQVAEGQGSFGKEWIARSSAAGRTRRRQDVGWLQVIDGAMPETIRRDQVPAGSANVRDRVVVKRLADRQCDAADPGDEEQHERDNPARHW